MNVLVTGSNGYIGSGIIRELSNNKKFSFYEGTRQTIDLYNKKNIEDYIIKNKINSIIHCAIEGGSRLKKDEADVFYNNLLIFENLISCKKLINKFINFSSGAEFDRETDIDLRQEEDIFNCVPKDFYGLSKNLIAKKVLSTHGCYNLRIFGCFNEKELDSRFIKSSIRKSIMNENIIIHEDKKMDFFYFDDLIKTVEFFLNSNLGYQDVNLSYNTKYKLSEIAAEIIKITNSNSKIIINKSFGNNYNGDSKKIESLPISIKGLKTGILETLSNYNL